MSRSLSLGGSPGQSKKIIFGHLKYPNGQYNCEIEEHAKNLSEYSNEIAKVMKEVLDSTLPDINTINRQPHMTPKSRASLVALCLSLSKHLRLLPYVVFRAVRYFDRYCSKRVVIPSEGPLLMSACVWIAAKFHGGNCHFAMKPEIKTPIIELSFGSGSRLFGPTQRFRFPRTKEILSCLAPPDRYKPSELHAMELNVLTTLDWNLSEPGIEDYLICSRELNVTSYLDAKERRPIEQEFSRMKQFIAYAVCFSEECIPYDVSQVAMVSVDIINDTFDIRRDAQYQTNKDELFDDPVTYEVLRNIIMRAVITSPQSLLAMFTDRGPQALYTRLVSSERKPSAENSGQSSLLFSAESSPAIPVTPETPRNPVCTPLTPKNLYNVSTRIAQDLKNLAQTTTSCLDIDKFGLPSPSKSVTGMYTTSSDSDDQYIHQTTIIPITKKSPSKELKKISIDPDFIIVEYTGASKTAQQSKLGIRTPRSETISRKPKLIAITQIASKIFGKS